MYTTETVGSSTLELLRTLQSKDYLQEFFLAGGTALALYFGHRKSLDIDLVSDHAFDTAYMLSRIQTDFSDPAFILRLKIRLKGIYRILTSIFCTRT